MLSSTDSDNKRAALDQLRFSKSHHENRSNLALASSSSHHSVHRAYTPPPTQSRDATIPSRFFNTPSSMGTVLVPSSSPITSEDRQRFYQPFSEARGYDVASTPGLNNHSPWGQSRTIFANDPLSAPSGFVSSGTNMNATLRRSRGPDERYIGLEQEDGPPRKRLNRGTSQDAFDVSDSPPSPAIQRAGHRRRIAGRDTDALSVSSDDSLPGTDRLLAGPSKPRIVKRPSPELTAASVPPEDIQFTRFRLTMPMESPARVQAAWAQTGGDVKRATEILSDPTWSPVSPPTVRAEKKEDMGRVKEIDEASKAQRAAVKEKGKKSMIYANRTVLDPQPISTPPTSIAYKAQQLPVTPATPLPVPPRRKRVKKLVIDSDSEPELVDGDDDQSSKRAHIDFTHEIRALEYFNSTAPAALQELTGCSPEQAETIIKLRPFTSIEDLNIKLGQGKKKAGPSGISSRLFEECTTIFKGYGTVDTILEDCERIGAKLRAAISKWSPTSDEKGKGKIDGLSGIADIDDGAISLRSLAPINQPKSKDYLVSQPSLVPSSVQLKEYQLLGVNWLNLLYRSNLSCILADEMGLGKTIQVISFLAYLKERGKKGPHLVIVPSSTLENWCREFSRFAPSISIQTYYAGKEERSQLRQTLIDTQRSKSQTADGWEVLITTYNLAQGDERDRKFFRRIDWDCCIFDEGHVLKNFQSQRYQSLLKFDSNWRLLLTGTPLQNNLQELVSLMNFILPDQFSDSATSLRAIFKVKGDSKVTLLSQERVSRAKKMMTPFVLRRRKDQVLKDLPSKTERIEWCAMTDRQRSIYNDALQRSRKTVLEMGQDAQYSDPTAINGKSKSIKKKSRIIVRPKDKEKMFIENGTNVLMDLRKAASHPMLFRTHYTDDILSGITKQLLKEPDFKKRGALFDLVKEDMSVMTDAELQVFCATYKSTRKYLQDEECYLDAGKVQVLLRLLSSYDKESRKVLVFSQFTQILDILQAIFKVKNISYLILTGSTPVDIRQTLVDEFTEDEKISVFLLSTKAGGMGINLTAASVVIMFDQDFNPHNDRQAQDRAYRIGQKRNVEVIKLISRNTIEEDMLRLGETKLALDEAVAGDVDEKEETAPEREMKTSLMNALRQQFEKQQEA